MATAFLPAQLLYVAAQFAATDLAKKFITGILVRPAKDGGIVIDSTDGIRAFNVTCPDATWHCDRPILLKAKSFIKRISHARMVNIDTDNEHARILGGKGASAEFIQAIPWKWQQEGCVCDDPALLYPNIDQIWPSSFHNAPGLPVAFNATLMADFLAQVKRYSWSGTVTMQLNGATNPLVLESSIRDTWLEDVTMRFLLMPVQIRS